VADQPSVKMALKCGTRMSFSEVIKPHRKNSEVSTTSAPV
jgi:hypothetical protein